MLIGGEAGIGKTALAEALLAEARRRGARVLIGRCYDLSETPPYGPWREAFEAAPADDDLPALPAALRPQSATARHPQSGRALPARAGLPGGARHAATARPAAR